MKYCRKSGKHAQVPLKFICGTFKNSVRRGKPGKALPRQLGTGPKRSKRKK